MVGSPPPERAAMMIARLSLLHSLPRLASMAPFLCLIVAQWECPDMVFSFAGMTRAECGMTGEAGRPRPGTPHASIGAGHFIAAAPGAEVSARSLDSGPRRGVASARRTAPGPCARRP